MNKIFLGILVVLIIGSAGLYVFFNREKNPTSPSYNSSTPTQSVSPTSTSQMDLGAGGSSYLDPKGIFSMLYPNDYTLDTADPKHIRIYKRGETQRPQSEMSDGALVVFETIDLQGSSLEAWVDTHLKESTADGTSEIVEPKKAVVQNTYPGFSYVLRGLGTSQNLVLQKDKSSNNAVLVTYSISDPKQKGYQEAVDAVLSSLKVLK